MSKLGEIMKKLSELENELEETHLYIQELLKNPKKTSSGGTVFCYFTHSFVIDFEDTSNLIIGNFHVKNASSEPVVSPTILLKIGCDEEFQFMGKYKLPDQSPHMYNYEWERLELQDFDPDSHYFLRPLHADEIPPDGELSFQNFQIIIPYAAPITVEGFVYFEGKQDGIASINYINIAG